jgi:hypothetical protein
MTHNSTDQRRLKTVRWSRLLDVFYGFRILRAASFLTIGMTERVAGHLSTSRKVFINVFSVQKPDKENDVILIRDTDAEIAYSQTIEVAAALQLLQILNLRQRIGFLD